MSLTTVSHLQQNILQPANSTARNRQNSNIMGVTGAVRWDHFLTVAVWPAAIYHGHRRLAKSNRYGRKKLHGIVTRRALLISHCAVLYDGNE